MFCHLVGKPPYSHCSSNKIRNNKIKQSNGNGKHSIIVAHWNLGSKAWKKKVNTIQDIVDRKKPDLLFISEANLYENTPNHESEITGYTIHKPKTALVFKMSRIILLARENLEIALESQLMNDKIASIWVKFSRPGARKLLVCGIYREHRYLHQDSDISSQPVAQLARWNNFMKQVEDAGTSASIHIIGDTNLDYQRWQNPDWNHRDMVQATKNTLETNGFTQLITEITRCWPGQVDSTIDHLWTNDQNRIMSTGNEVEAVGDHNWIQGHIRLTGKDSKRLDTRRRDFRNFDPVEYRRMLSEVDWTGIYELEDVNLANSFLEDNLNPILNKLCPLTTVQYRNKQKSLDHK